MTPPCAFWQRAARVGVFVTCGGQSTDANCMKRVRLFCLPAVFAALGISRSGGAPALKVAEAVPLPHVKGGFDLMAADVAGKRLFVAAEDNNTIEVIDLAGGKHLRSVGGFKEPKWVRIYDVLL